MSSTIYCDINNIIRSLERLFMEDFKYQSSTERLISEVKYTSDLQRLVDAGNKFVLKNFNLRLQMDIDNDSDNDNYLQHSHHSCDTNERSLIDE